MPKQLWEILVPTVKDNEAGKYYSTRYHRVWDAKVRQISGGLTILKPVSGQWISNSGKLWSERVIPVRIACNENQIEQIADITQKHYQQEAIMYYLISEYVVIKTYK